VRTKALEEIETHILRSVTLFESQPFMR